MWNRICCYEYVETEEGIYFPWCSGNGLCFLSKDKNEAELLGEFSDYAFVSNRLYKTIQKIDDKIVLPPLRGSKIVVFDCKTKKMDEVCLREMTLQFEVAGKFWTSLVYERDIYFIGSYYPAIVKFNVDTYKTEYITDWKDSLGSNGYDANSPYFVNGIIMGEIAYLPFGCINAVLKLDLKDGSSKRVDLETDVCGFNGIVYCDGLFWMTARSSDEIILWDEESSCVQTIIITPKKGDYKYAGFHAPIKYKDTIIVLPFDAAHAYLINSQTKEVKVFEELEYMYQAERMKNIFPSLMILGAKITGNQLCFITAYDFRWNLIDMDTYKVSTYEVVPDMRMKKHIVKGLHSHKWKKNKMGKIKKVMFEAEEISCQDYIDFIWASDYEINIADGK